MALVNHHLVDFLGMTGGLNTVKSAVSLSPSEARDLQDIDLFPIGGFSKRNGYTQLNSSAVSANSCTGLYMARYSLNGGTNIAYLVNDTKLYSMSSALGGTWADATNSLTITTGPNNIWCFDILNDIAVLGNGTDAPIQISSSGTATALFSGQPLTKFLFPLQTRGYMFYFRPTVSASINYDRCYFSSIGDPTVVGTNNFIDVGKGQGGDIRGAVEYKTYLYVFKRHGIYQLNFQPTQVDSTGTLFPWTQNPNPIVPGVGTQSHRTIVKFTTPETHATPGQEYVFFIDQFGIPRIFDGTTTISFASKIGFSRDSNILSLSDMVKTQLPYSFAINYPERNKILFFMSSASSQQNRCWTLDYSTGFAISRYKYASAFNVGALFEKADGTFRPYVGDYAGKVHQLDSGTTDNGTAISDYYRVGDNFLKSPSMRSKWYFLDVRGTSGSSSQNIKVSYFVNGSSASTGTTTSLSLRGNDSTWGPGMIWGTAVWSSQTLVQKTAEINLVAKTLAIKIESAVKLTDTYTIESFTMAGDVLGTAQD